MSETAKKKRRQQSAALGGSRLERSGAGGDGGSDSGDQTLRDRLWGTACDLAPPQLTRGRRAEAERAELRAALEGLAKLDLETAGPATVAGPPSRGEEQDGDEGGLPAAGGGEERQGPEQKEQEQKEQEQTAEEEEGSWLSATFDEDWFLITEREEEEQRQREAERQRQERR